MKEERGENKNMNWKAFILILIIIWLLTSTNIISDTTAYIIIGFFALMSIEKDIENKYHDIIDRIESLEDKMGESFSYDENIDNLDNI